MKSFVWFELEGGSVVEDWNKIQGRIKRIKLDVVTLGLSANPPYIILEGYEKYMHQKYAMVGVGVSGKSVNVPFAGLQIGGYKGDAGWVVLDVNFLERVVRVNLTREITSIAIKEGC